MHDEREDPLRVVVGVEDAPTRAGIRVALASDRLAVVGEAATADSLLHLVATRRPAVCLIGTGLPGGSVRAAREAVCAAPGTAVVLLAGPEIAADVVGLLCDGVAGCVGREVPPARLGPALRAAAAGELLVPRQLVSRLVDELRRDDRRRGGAGRPAELPSLVSNREWRVVELLSHGRSTSEVAASLGLSPVTVRRHVSSVMRKLGVADRESVFRLAARRG